jgi:hypothetical protein
MRWARKRGRWRGSEAHLDRADPHGSLVTASGRGCCACSLFSVGEAYFALWCPTHRAFGWPWCFAHNPGLEEHCGHVVPLLFSLSSRDSSGVVAKTSGKGGLSTAGGCMACVSFSCFSLSSETPISSVYGPKTDILHAGRRLSARRPRPGSPRPVRRSLSRSLSSSSLLSISFPCCLNLPRICPAPLLIHPLTLPSV